MTDGQTGDARPDAGEWRAGWPVTVAAGVGFSVATMHYAIVSVLMKSLSGTYGWSRTEITVGLTMATLIWPICGLFVGRLADRIGARRLALVGICGIMVGLAGAGIAGPDIRSWWLAWFLFPLLGACASPVVWTLAVASRFERSRALALAVALSVSGVSGAIVPILTSQAFDAFGLRGAFWAMAAGGLAIAFATTWFFFYDARDLARLRREGGERAGRAAGPAPATTGYELSEAVRQSRFWRLGLALLLVSAGVGAVSIHLQPMLTDGGLTRTQAAGIAGVTGPAVVVGRICTGWLMDRLYGPAVAATAFGLGGIAYSLFLQVHGDPAIAVVAAVIAGLAAGAEIDIVAYLTSRYFGMRRYGVIYGCMFGLYTAGVGLMPVAGGFIYDTFGSYDRLFLGLAVAMAIAALLAATLGRYPVFEERVEGA